MTAIGAIDIGGTKIAVGMVDENGRILSRTDAPSQSVAYYRDALDAIIKMLRSTTRTAGVEFTGIGIGSTGPVDPFTGCFGDIDFFPHWKDHSLVDDLQKEFGVEAALENDGDAAALAEASWGAGRSKSRLIYVTVGTGIGGGMIFDGSLYRGVDGAHPEVGHHVIEAGGPACSCGFSGCWEALATGPALAKWMQAQPGCPEGETITGRRVFEWAVAGHPLALRAVERESFYLGLGLANLVNLFTPDCIVLGGSVMKSSALLMDGIRKTMHQGCRFVPLEKAELALASLGEEANLIGAARVWHYRLGGNGHDKSAP